MPPAVVQPRGLVRIVNRGIEDDGGPFYGRGTSLFWGPWAYKVDRPKLEQNLDYLASFPGALNFVRQFCSVGGTGWENRTIDPNWSDFDETLLGAIDLAFQRGFRSMLTIFASANVQFSSAASRPPFVRRIVALANRVPEKIHKIEIANEYWQNGFSEEGSELRSLTKLAASLTSIPVASSTPKEQQPTVEDFQQAYRNIAAGTIGVHHGERKIDTTDGRFRPVRQGWGWQFEVNNAPGLPKAWEETEPIGINSSVKEENDPYFLVLAAFIHALSRCAGWLLHTGAGVFGRTSSDGSRKSNFWEQPTMADALKGLAAMAVWLPPDIANWSPKQWDDPTHPFDYPWGRDAYDSEFIRTYAMRKGTNFICCPFGMTQRNPSRPVGRLVARSAMHVEAFDFPFFTPHALTQHSGQVSLDLAPGQTLLVTGPAVALRGHVA